MEIEHVSAERTQRTYARLAGFLFLWVIVVAFGGGFILSRVAGARVGLATVVVATLSGVVLFFALYVTLKPVNSLLALLAMIFSLVDSSLGCVVQMCGFVRLHLNASAQTVVAGMTQAQALSDLMRNIAGTTENIGGISFGAGSLLFFYLFFKSGYIPRIVSGLGVLASAIWIALYFDTLVFPEQRTIVQYICFPPMGIAQLTTGFWLLLFAVRKYEGSDSVRKETKHVPVSA